MAGTNLEALVLHRKPVVSDVVTGMASIDSNPAKSQTPDDMSMRRLSQRLPRAGYKPASRRVFADDLGEDFAVDGAGRLRSRSGVLVRRSPARAAGRTILSGWSCAVGVSRSSAADTVGLQTANSSASGSKLLPEHPLSFHAGIGHVDSHWLQRGRKPGRCWEGRLASFMPGGGMLPASTRGTGIAMMP
jgi:hypothetical protein